MSKSVIISVDAMGGDHAPQSIVDGIDKLARTAQAKDVHILLHGNEQALLPLMKENSAAAGICDIRHTNTHVAMTDKPSQAIRKARGSSMWNAVEAVKEGKADACVSAGNTGALMVLSKVLLRMAKNAHRPAIAASWPTPHGSSVVLDVGANIECTAAQLVEFAIMGEGFYRALHGTKNPAVGLLNIGTEDLKGDQVVRDADALLRTAGLDLNYAGFIEGDDISMGSVDVVVTDGFTGNVALKTAEGTAKLAGVFLRESLQATLLSRLGALLARGGFARMRARMDPRKFNGGVFLGLGGVVVKSHGGTDGLGFANALKVALRMARFDYSGHVAGNLQQLADNAGTHDTPRKSA